MDNETLVYITILLIITTLATSFSIANIFILTFVKKRLADYINTFEKCKTLL